ncbi:hypothetical protein PG988_006583 [Apiospora saccharicola]
MARSDKQKQELKEAAQNEAKNRNLQVDADETTATGNFPFKTSVDAVGVMVDLSSDKGFVQISNLEQSRRVDTGSGSKGFKYEDIKEGESCMLYGCPTVFYLLKVA